MQWEKHTVHLSAIFAALLCTLLLSVSCSQNQVGQLPEYTVTLYSEVGGQPKVLKVEEGTPLLKAQGYEKPVYQDYTFGGFVDEDANDFYETDVILKDLTLYSTFIKTQKHDYGSNSYGTFKESVCTDGTSLEVQVYSSTETYEEVNNVYKRSVSIQSTKGNETPSIERIIEYVFPESEGVSKRIVEISSLEEHKRYVFEESLVSEGNQLKVVTTEYDNEGSEPKLLNTSTVYYDVSPSLFIDRGIDALSEIEGISDWTQFYSSVTQAEAYFNKAYERFPENDEAKFYSALADLANIAASEELSNFFKNHLGVTNYPTDLGTLLKGDWLYQKTFDESKNVEVSCKTFEEVATPSEGNEYYYKVRAFDEEKDSVEPETYYLKDLYMQFSGDSTKYVTRCVENNYSPNQTGYKALLFDPFPSYYVGDENYLDYGSEKMVLDDDAEDGWWYYAKHPYVAGKKAYSATDGKTSYTVKLTRVAPDLNTTFKGGFLSSVPSQFLMLFFANVLQDNSEGFSEAVSDLYTAVFESDRYNALCDKIESIRGRIEVPSEIISEFGLDRIFGNASLTLGKSELILLKSSMDLMKAVLQYAQSYSFNMGLQFALFDWNNLWKLLELYGKVASYNKDIDPFAQGLLTERADAAMWVASSRDTLLGVIDNVQDAYEDIVWDSKTFPAILPVILNKAGVEKLVEDFFTQLRSAIQRGTKFYIPSSAELSGEMLTKWPTSGETFVDFGAVFTKGAFAATNGIDFVTTDKGHDAPVIYVLKHNSEKNIYEVLKDGEGNKVSVTKADQISGYSSSEYALGISIEKYLNKISSISSFTNLDTTNSTLPYIQFSTFVGTFIVNFYYK